MAKTASATRSVPFDPGLGELMAQSGVSYRRLAEMTELSAGYLNHVVHGNRPVPSADSTKSAHTSQLPA